MDHYSVRRPLTVRIPSSPPADPSSDNEPRRKRRRTSGDVTPVSSTVGSNGEEGEPVESIDLTQVDGTSSLAKVLAKQRQDAVKAQQEAEQEAEQEKGCSLLTAYKCPVCMDTPVDATTTVCGHLFCHKCIVDALKFSENQRLHRVGKRFRGTCPVCRKTLSQTDVQGTKRDLVPLQLQLTRRGRNPVPADSA